MVHFFIYLILAVSLLLVENTTLAEQGNSNESLPPGLVEGAKDRGNGDPKYWKNNPVSGIRTDHRTRDRSRGHCDQSKCIAMPMDSLVCGDGEESVWETPKRQCCPILKCKPVKKRWGSGCNTKFPAYACPTMEPVCNPGEEVVKLPLQIGPTGSCCPKKVCRKIGVKDGRENDESDPKPKVAEPMPVPPARAI